MNPQYPQYPQQPQQPQQPQYVQPVSIFNWLVPNILLTILCCNLFAIIGIVFSSQVNGKLQRGDYNGAKGSATNAKITFWVCLALSIIGWVAYIIFGGLLAVIGLAGAANGQ